MLNEDESGDSSQPDEEGSDDGESDDNSQEDFNTLGDDQLERRTYVIIFHRLIPLYSKFIFCIFF